MGREKIKLLTRREGEHYDHSLLYEGRYLDYQSQPNNGILAGYARSNMEALAKNSNIDHVEVILHGENLMKPNLK